MSTMMFLARLLIAAALYSSATAFVVRPLAARKSTTLFLEDWVADLIGKWKSVRIVIAVTGFGFSLL